MSGRGKGKTAGKKSVSRSTKAGLQVAINVDHLLHLQAEM